MPNAPVIRKTRSPSGSRGMLGSGTPVWISPTTATPRADRSSAVERTMPTMSAMSGPGMRGAIRLRSRIPTSEPTPRIAVIGSVSARTSWPIPTRRSRVVPTTGGMPSRPGSWPIVIVMARPMTNPVTTEIARNCDRKPSRAAPATTRMTPTTRARPALRATYDAGSRDERIAPTTEADRIATDELAVTFRWRDVPKMAYAVSAANAVTRPVSGGMPARPA